MKHKQNYVNMADVCELAHELTIMELGDKGEKIIKGTRGVLMYTKKGQEVFDAYYDLITNILKV